MTLSSAAAPPFWRAEIAHFFDVSVPTLSSWAAIHEDFGAALQKGGAAADERVKRSLYHRAVGYSYESEKIIYDAQSGEVIRAPIVVHVPPDVKAQMFWLKNRDPKNWRDRRALRRQVEPSFAEALPRTLKYGHRRCPLRPRRERSREHR